MSRVFLIEDHDEALKVWRKKDIRGLDLVHLDAHIDFGFHPAMPIGKAVRSAKSVKELKEKLEYSLAFLRYEKDLGKQTNIGNYIYPAIEEGIVRNFYWVIPGRLRGSGDSGKTVKNILKKIVEQQGNKNAIFEADGDGMAFVRYSGRNFIVCDLDNLPSISQDVILDIDIDFLVIDTIAKAANTALIGKRRPWILPKNLAETLKAKIKNPEIITIAYSVNGGWTPMGYKHLGDELAYHLEPSGFKRRFKKSRRAGRYFNLFNSTGKKEFYERAAALDPAYRLTDNNFGPLYLISRKFSLAQKEYERILRVDRNNPASLFGLGMVALERKEFGKAKRYLHSASQFTGNNRLFSATRKKVLFGLGKAEFHLKNFKRATELLAAYKNIFPLEPESYYLLGRIFEKGRKFPEAAVFYKDAVRLGYGGMEPLFRLLKISAYLEDRYDIIRYLRVKHKDFKKRCLELERLSLKERKKIKGLIGHKKKVSILESKLADF